MPLHVSYARRHMEGLLYRQGKEHLTKVIFGRPLIKCHIDEVPSFVPQTRFTLLRVYRVRRTYKSTPKFLKDKRSSNSLHAWQPFSFHTARFLPEGNRWFSHSTRWSRAVFIMQHQNFKLVFRKLRYRAGSLQ